MKRMLFVIALAGIMVSAGVAQAQYKDGAILFTFGGGALLATSNETGESITGNAINFTLEKVLSDGRLSVGIAIPYIFADETITIEGNDPMDVTYSGSPFMLTCKYNIINGGFALFAGGGIGIHYSNMKLYAGTSDEKTESYTGLAFNIPIGVAFYLAEDFYLQGTYSLTLYGHNAIEGRHRPQLDARIGLPVG